MRAIFFFAMITTFVACNGTNKTTKTNKRTMTEIYFAGGCFWGTEHFMKQIEGVENTQTGYANSTKAEPTYKEVCSGATGAAETVKVSFDEQILPMRLLISLYFKTIDPFSINQQGNDRGTQYRTGIYFNSPSDGERIADIIKEITKGYDKPMAVEIKALENFYPAEDYHQDYLDNNPSGYCHISPALFEMARKAKAVRDTEK